MDILDQRQEISLGELQQDEDDKNLNNTGSKKQNEMDLRDI